MSAYEAGLSVVPNHLRVHQRLALLAASEVAVGLDRKLLVDILVVTRREGLVREEVLVARVVRDGVRERVVNYAHACVDLLLQVLLLGTHAHLRVEAAARRGIRLESERRLVLVLGQHVLKRAAA